MQAAKNWCDGERVKKLGILRGTKQGLGWNMVADSGTYSQHFCI
jgi:hypothetical protein